MYADDGVIMSENADGLKEYLGVKPRLAGVYLAEDKNHGLISQLKFLGLTLNTLNGTISDGKKSVCVMRDSKELEHILSYASYEKKRDQISLTMRGKAKISSMNKKNNH